MGQRHSTVLTTKGGLKSESTGDAENYPGLLIILMIKY